MVEMRVEIEGSVEEVVRVIRQLGGAGQPATVGGADRPVEQRPAGVGEPAPAAGVPNTAVVHAVAPVGWTEALASEYLAGLDASARRMAFHVWRAGAAGIHRSALCQRTELSPAELRSLLMRMGHALRRFQQERGLALSRPVAANSPQQSYFVDLEFAAVANARMFDDSRRFVVAANVGAYTRAGEAGSTTSATVEGT